MGVAVDYMIKINFYLSTAHCMKTVMPKVLEVFPILDCFLRKRSMLTKKICSFSHKQEVPDLNSRLERHLFCHIIIRHHLFQSYFHLHFNRFELFVMIIFFIFRLLAVPATADQQHRLPGGGQQAVLQPAQVQLPPAQHLKSPAESLCSESLRKMEQHLVTYIYTYMYAYIYIYVFTDSRGWNHFSLCTVGRHAVLCMFTLIHVHVCEDKERCAALPVAAE